MKLQRDHMNDCISRQLITGQEAGSFYWWISSFTGQSFASRGINSPARLDDTCQMCSIVPVLLVHGILCFSNNRQDVAWEVGDLLYLHEVRYLHESCARVSWSSWWWLNRIHAELVTTEVAEVNQVAKGLGDRCDWKRLVAKH